MKVNHFLILLACMTVAISLGGSLLPTTYAAEKQENIPVIGMPNPWVAHKDMQTAEQAVGFPFRVPKTIGDMKPVKIERWITISFRCFTGRRPKTRHVCCCGRDMATKMSAVIIAAMENPQ